MAPLDDREASLIRVEEQLKESAKNQASIMTDLKEIFGRLEKESKNSTIISGEIKGHLATDKLRWDSISKRLDDGDALFKDIDTKMDAEKEARSTFETEIKSSVKTIKWVFGTLATVAAALSTLLGIIQLLGKLS